MMYGREVFVSEPYAYLSDALEMAANAARLIDAIVFSTGPGDWHPGTVRVAIIEPEGIIPPEMRRVPEPSPALLSTIAKCHRRGIHFRLVPDDRIVWRTDRDPLPDTLRVALRSRRSEFVGYLRSRPGHVCCDIEMSVPFRTPALASRS